MELAKLVLRWVTKFYLLRDKADFHVVDCVILW